MSKEEKEFYVSNIRLYAEYIEWYANIKVAQESDIEEPEIPAFIVESMIKISKKLSFAGNFINYSFKDEMISDALYDCVRYAKKFNPEIIKSECGACKVSKCAKREFNTGCKRKSNPFSYLTTICFRAFLRRIDSEKKQKYIKSKIVSDFPLDEFLDTQSHEDDTKFINQYIEFLRENSYSDNSVPMSIKRGQKKKEIIVIIDENDVNLENLDE